MSQELKFIISYDGGEAVNHRVDLYDAAKSMQGLARALAISSHALVSNGEIRRRVETIPNVKFYLQPGQKGSLIEIVTVVFSDSAVQAIGSSVLGAAFWDMISFSWRHATGTTPEPTHNRNKKIVRENEEFSNEISDALENSLNDLHAPIMKDSRMKIEIRKPRGEVILELNQETLNHVLTSKEGEIQTDILGNVSKYNIVSGYGRFYDDTEEKTIPFNLSNNMPTRTRGVLTRSLHFAGQRGEGKILLDATVILKNNGQVKRYIIHDAKEIE